MPRTVDEDVGPTYPRRCRSSSCCRNKGVGVDECAAGVDERAAKDGRSGPAIPLTDVLLSTMLTHADRLWCGIRRL